MPSRSFDPIASMVFSLDSDSFSKGHSVYIRSYVHYIGIKDT